MPEDPRHTRTRGGLTPVPTPAARALQRTLDLAFEIHSEVGPGCFERVYIECLCDLLMQAGHRVEREVVLPIRFRGRTLAAAYRADIVVDEAVVVEVKSVSELLPVHRMQLHTYIVMGSFPVGLLLNFGAAHLREGYDRMVHPRHVFLPPSRLGSSGQLGSSGITPADPPTFNPPPP